MILRKHVPWLRANTKRVLFRRKPDRGGFGVPELVKQLFRVALHEIVQGGIVASRQPRHVVCVLLIAGGSVHGAGLLVRLACHPLLLLAGRSRMGRADHFLTHTRRPSLIFGYALKDGDGDRGHRSPWRLIGRSSGPRARLRLGPL